MESNLFDVKGKVVVMTGACGVLGSTIVKYFASQGASVVLLDLERAAAIGEKIVAEIKADGGGRPHSSPLMSWISLFLRRTMSRFSPSTEKSMSC